MVLLGFKASYNALILWLNVCSEVGLKIFGANALKARGNNVARKIVLQEKYLLFLPLKFTVPLLNPFFVEISSHPGLCVDLVEKSKLKTGLLVEGTWMCCFANDKKWQLLRPVGIEGECICEMNLIPFNS